MPYTHRGREHIEHLLELGAMLTSAPAKESLYSKNPKGFRGLWEPFFKELFLVACLMYLEKVFGTDKHWLKSENISDYPMLFKKLESLRFVRNCIVHNGGTLTGWENKGQVKHIKDFERQVRDGEILEEMGPRRGSDFKGYYTIDSAETVIVSDESAVRSITLQYLSIEGQVELELRNL